MLNRIAELNLLNQAAGAPALGAPTGLEGAALARLGGLTGSPLAGVGGADSLDILGQGNLQLAGMMEWASELNAANQQVTAMATAAAAAGGASINPINPLTGSSATPSLGGVPAVGGAAPAAAGPGAGSSAPSAGGSTGAGTMQNPQDAGPGAAEGGTGEWGPEDEKFLDQDVQKNQQGGSGPAAGGDHANEFNEVFKDFGQTSEGNCATVAVMKAAMDKYGTKVFDSVTKSGDGITVKQQDGKSVTVSSSDLKQAAQAAKLKGKPSAAKSMAVLMYAVVGKNHGGVNSLGNGADPKQIAKDLGLGNKIKEIDPSQAGNAKDGAVAWNGTHAVYEGAGKADHYGTPQGADGTDTRGGKLTNAFEFA